MKSSWQFLIKTAKLQMWLCLFLIAISAVLHYQSFVSIFSIFLALIATLASDILFLKLRKIEPFFPNAAIVTGLIIGLLTYYQLPWYEIVITGIIAMFAKNFLRIHNRHIFNPAGFGLFVTSLLFHQSVSWWGVSFQNLIPAVLSMLLFFILISPGLVSMIRLKRYYILTSFISAYILLTSGMRLLQHNFSAFTILQVTLFSSTILFFSLVMLPEPMTSPNNHKRQFIYGSSIAILALVLSFLFPKYFPDTLIGALLIGNAAFFEVR